MQVEAIYHQGKLEFSLPVKLRSGRISLVVQIPDEAVINDTTIQSKTSYELPPDALALALAMEDKLDKIRNAPPPDEANLPPLSAKQLERIEAFSRRDEVKGLY